MIGEGSRWEGTPHGSPHPPDTVVRRGAGVCGRVDRWVRWRCPPATVIRASGARRRGAHRCRPSLTPRAHLRNLPREPGSLRRFRVMMLEHYLLVVLAGIALLASFYAGWWYLRFRRRGRDYLPENQWPGRGIDATRVLDRVHRVRHDYVAELQARSSGTTGHRGLLATMRKTVGRLSYFRKRSSQRITSEDETEKHTS